MPLRYATDDTIAAIATGLQPAHRAIVRISGPDAHRIARILVAVPRWPETFPAAVDGHLTGAGTASVPADLWLWQRPASYTGESMAEIHLPGPPALARWVLERCLLAGARAAEPGEFTLRAFLHGKLDLTEAEAVLAVTQAGDVATLRTALKQLDGGLAEPLTRLRALLVDLLVELEAALDFAEEDIQFITPEQLIEGIDRGIALLEEVQRQMHEREQAPVEPVVVLAGEPNAGKSSLFNALCQGELAIVAPLAGTTRDYLSARLSLDSAVTIRLVDTPGIDEQPATTADRQAQQLARTLHSEAAVRLWCLPCDRLAASDNTAAPATGLPLPPDDPREWLVVTKADLVSPEVLAGLCEQLRACRPGRPVVAVSTVGPPGIDALLAALSSWAGSTAAQAAAGVVPETAARCRRSIATALTELRHARRAAAEGLPDELVASALRAALHEIGLVTGEVHVEEILDAIFRRFCIGK